MVHSGHLRRGTLALVDTDANRLSKMARLARLVIEHHRVPLKLEASTNRRDVLEGADFVVLSFAYKNAHFRGVDCELAAKYGIRMISGDTIGPGGVYRAMREYPEIVRTCQDVQELCSGAWVLNYINPAAVHGIGLMRHFPGLKSFALCDGQSYGPGFYGLKREYAALAGICTKEQYDQRIDREMQVLTAGPNHFTWLIRAEYRGEDLVPKIAAAQRERPPDEVEKTWGVFGRGLELYDAFGCLPTNMWHTQEYVRFWQGHNQIQQKYAPLTLFSALEREAWTRRVWERVDAYVSGAAPIAEFDTEFGPDLATDIIECMWAKLGKRYFINTANRGAITNMASDAFLELYCDVDLDGPRPVPIGPMPRGVRAMCETVLDTHELTAEAIYRQDRALLRRALLTDPLAQSIEDTDALMSDLFQAEREALPEHWFQVNS
jgi:alpha-galactosidase